MSPLSAQIGAELSLVRRNGEQLLVTLGIPLLLLGFFGSVDILPTDTDEPVDFLVPGILALAIMSTSMVSLGIATGFERSYLVLKRLAATPLGTGRLIAAKTIAVVCVEAVQMALLVGLGLALGWGPASANWLLALAAVVVGTFAFAGIGLALAGNLRGEVNLAASNGLYLVLLLLGGVLFPLDRLPSFLQAIGRATPTHALADVLADSLMSTGTHTATSWLVLGAWAVIAPIVAARTFRWS
ncbi:MAG: ABC transporter permease [Acidobacteria bacterium]|nr:ABC transporter permease [Acidobacteriota bacterium]